MILFKSLLSVGLVVGLIQASTAQTSFASDASATSFRPPAVALVTADPYLSIWSEADHLTDDVTRHWTHRPHPLNSLIRVDDHVFRLMGSEPKDVPALPQVGLEVTPTRSIYHFANDHVEVRMTFMSPQLPDDLDVMTRPITYVDWSVKSLDDRSHKVSIFQSVSSELAIDSPGQTVNYQSENANGLAILKVGTRAQTLLTPEGDDVRIDWGYAYLAMPKSQGQASAAAPGVAERTFIESGSIKARTALFVENAPDAELSTAFDLGQVGGESVDRHVMIGYDEVYSIDLFGKKLRPYWRRGGASMASLMAKAEAEYPSLRVRCASFDRELTADAARIGGAHYAQILALAYRECVAAVGIAADANGKPLLFTKEDTSNGDIATVDVIFPMDPIWVLLSPTLAKASLVSVFEYAASPHWKFPNAPHDLGTYPRAEGRDDGGEGMPVEESGNMILLADAISHDDGNVKFAQQWWPQLTQWAHYLEQYGLDPEDQLCTDDFMGHLAHNANLAVKAILALGAYGDMCRIKGDQAEADRYLSLARADAKHWVEVADEGSRSRLAFDQPGTWSQKYNLVWDRILGLNVFPPTVAEKEIAFYKTQLQPFGLPLDSRTHLTKTDWSIWSASMANENKDFQAFIDPIFAYLNTTSSRDPIADSYMTDDASSSGMHARPVVGGFFIKMLTDPSVWHKWSSRGPTLSTGWAPLPVAPQVTEIVPTARIAKVIWRYTTTSPDSKWTQPDFDDHAWSEGFAGFGTEGTPSAIIGTKWDTDDIWIRRTLTMPRVDPKKLRLIIYHDEDIEVYVNGVQIAAEPGYENQYKTLELSPEALKAIPFGQTITIAAHCHQTTGGQGIDVGFGVLK